MISYTSSKHKEQFTLLNYSDEARKSVNHRLSGLRKKVFDAIRYLGEASDEDISIETGLNPNTSRPRRIELERQGFIVLVGEKLTSSGRKCGTYKVNVQC